MRKSIVITAILLPLIGVIFFTYKYGITRPILDQWDIVPLLEKMHNHALGVTDLWNQHNEHRIIFPKIIMLILAHLSNWNIFLELCVNILLAIFIFIFTLSILRSTSEAIPPWLKIFTSMMIFSMAQYQNWTWGWQIQMFMSMLGSVIAIWAANKWQGQTKGLTVVIAASILSSYSFNSGLLTWPSVLVVFLLQKKWKLKHIIILFSACTATVLLYYYKYTKPVYHPSVLYFISHPLIYIKYVLTFLGNSLSGPYCPPYVTGTIFVVFISIIIFNLYRSDKQKLCDLAPWIALILYACMAACMTGVGRAGFGWGQAMESRYVTISLYLPLSAGVLFWHLMNLIVKNSNVKRRLYAVIIVMFIISYTNNYYSSVKTLKMGSTFFNILASMCITNPETTDDYFIKKLYLYSPPSVLRSRIKTLSELGIKFKDFKYTPENQQN